jgi:hypothetical protein
MQNGRKTNMNRRQQRPAASFAARSKPWSSNANRPEPGSHNAQRNYQRYLELARAEALTGNTVGAENYYQHAEHLFQVDVLGQRGDIGLCSNDRCYQKRVLSEPSSSHIRRRLS